MDAAATKQVPKNKLTRRRSFFSVPAGFDMPFFILLMLVLAVGLVSLFSASFAYSYYWNDGDSYYYIRRQLVFTVIGLAGMFFLSAVNCRWLCQKFIVYGVLGISVILLIWVRFFAAPIKDVYRWIRIFGLQIQPSEIAKFAVILLFAYWGYKLGEKIKTFKQGFLPFMGVLALICGLVVIEPHLSGTILIAGIGFVMMFAAGTRWYWLLGTLVLGVLGVLVLVLGFGYERERIDVWLDPLTVYNTAEYAPGVQGRDLAWQTVQSLYAIGSGGLMGEGLGNSRQKHLFLPEPQNDFIFAVVCEEMGFVGAILVIVLFALLVWRGFVISLRAPDKFSSLLAIGLTAQIGLQVILNLAVVTNTMPNTGISLPFFSYGGSSLVMLLWQMGILLSISRHAKK